MVILRNKGFSGQQESKIKKGLRNLAIEQHKAYATSNNNINLFDGGYSSMSNSVAAKWVKGKLNKK